MPLAFIVIVFFSHYVPESSFSTESKFGGMVEVPISKSLKIKTSQGDIHFSNLNNISPTSLYMQAFQ